jgi:hypothetical protein
MSLFGSAAAGLKDDGLAAGLQALVIAVSENCLVTSFFMGKTTGGLQRVFYGVGWMITVVTSRREKRWEVWSWHDKSEKAYRWLYRIGLLAR